MGGYINTPKIDKLKLDDTSHLIKMAEYYTNGFCDEYKIDDIVKISENRFKACLTYIYNHYFKLSLYTDKKRAPAIDNVIDYTDIGQLNAILNSYLYLCRVCDKIPSIQGFSLYCGIESNTLYQWEADFKNNDIYNIECNNSSMDILAIWGQYNSINNSDINSYIDNSNDYINNIKSIADRSIYRRNLVLFRYLITKSIKESKENSLSDRLASGGQGLIGCIAILNHNYGWSENSSPNITINQPQISISDLPKLTDGNGNG